MSELVGQTLGHYRIVEKIGAGGMGVVYRAHDERLDRDVAIKVLPVEVAQDPARLERFRREARAVARLSHPNILEIHDFGREGEMTYAVTELLEGQTLCERVPTSGLPWQKVVEIGAAIADGLAAAHGKGIVHRDLKPENIFMTTDGRIKILDFGLAAIREQVLSEAETGTLTPAGTQPGTILGTLGYMSPEQLKGDTADARSDIFALGCVLYEMVSGRRAFGGSTAAEAVAEILKEEPGRLSSIGATLPVELETNIHRCLEKSPDARFQSAADLAHGLRTISSPSAVSMARPPSRTRGWKKFAPWAAIGMVMVAVLVMTAILRGPLSERGSPALPEVVPDRVAVAPLENRTGDPSLDTLGVLAADLIVQRFTETAVAEVVPLEDSSHAGAEMDETGAGTDVLDRARQRGAGLILAGAYYLDGETLRLQARLVDTATGDLIYAFEPVAVPREEAAEGIESLRERVLAAVAAHITFPVIIDISVVNPPSKYEAFQAFQRGEELFNTDRVGALAHFRRALETDPDFRFPRIESVYVLANLGDPEGVEREVLALERQLDRMTPYERSFVPYFRSLMLEEDLPGSLIQARRMVDLAPNLPGVRIDLGWRALDLNRPEEALEALEPVLLWYEAKNYRAEYAWWPLVFIANAHHMLGNFERELEYANLGLESLPGVTEFFLAKTRGLAAMGRSEAVDEVIDTFLHVRTRSSKIPYEEGRSAGWLMSEAAKELRAHGHREASDSMAARSVEWYEGHPSTITEEGWPFANALWMLGRRHDLDQFVVQMIDAQPSDSELAVWLGVIAAVDGSPDRAMEISSDLPVNTVFRAPAWKNWQAAIAAHVGEKDTAVELLAEGFSQGKIYDVHLHSTPLFEPLWDYPAFQKLIEPKG